MSKLDDHYIALGAAALVVAMLHKEKKLPHRAAITLASAGVGHTTGPEIAAVFGWLGENLAVVGVTALAFVVLEAASGLIADRDALKALVRARFPGKSGGE